MKKIIEGKLYNTKTAKMIGEGGNGRGRNDFSYYEEELYIKRTGEYFWYGCGGPMSRYAESCGRTAWTGGEAIIPLTEKEAREWAEENLDADDYMEIFGEISEDGEKTSVCLLLANYELAKQRASEAGLSLSAYIDNLIK